MTKRGSRVFGIQETQDNDNNNDEDLLVKPKEEVTIQSSFLKPEMKSKLKNEFREVSSSKYIEQMDFNDQILCHKMEKSPLFLIQEPSITVSRPVSKNKSMFSSKSGHYFIQVYEIGSEVHRKLEDFIWLKETLNSIFPSVFVSNKW